MDPQWVSGIYLVRIIDSLGFASYYPFVLKGERPADFVFVAAQFTWQAYNQYGASLYYPDPNAPTSTFGHAVSFERPYYTGSGTGLLLGSWSSHELRLLRWLERSGYDVSYVSDLDLALPGVTPPHPKHGLLFAGHDEYWTWDERDLVEQLRNSGTHLAFFAGNNAYWNVRLSAGPFTGRPGHLVTCYKGRVDPGATGPHDAGVHFRDPPLNRPENSLYGVMFATTAYTPLQPAVVFDTTTGPEVRGFLDGAGLASGDTLSGLASYEGDFLWPTAQTPKNIQVIARTPVHGAQVASSYYYTTFFVAPSGAGVFASGHNEYAKLLDSFLGSTENVKVQALTKGILDWMRSH